MTAESYIFSVFVRKKKKHKGSPGEFCNYVSFDVSSCSLLKHKGIMEFQTQKFTFLSLCSVSRSYFCIWLQLSK